MIMQARFCELNTINDVVLLIRRSGTQVISFRVFRPMVRKIAAALSETSELTKQQYVPPADTLQ